MATLLVFASPAAANPVEPGSLILTSTSGQYWEIGCPNSITGTAAGTITLTPFVSASSAINYRITAGAVSLGATTYAITGGEALVTQEFITGHGTVQGGSFNFSAFSVSPTARPPPYSYNTVMMQLQVGGNYYFVLLHVRTAIIAAARA